MIEDLNGPFKHIANRWHFKEAEDGVAIDLEFRSRGLQALIGSLFGHELEKLM